MAEQSTDKYPINLEWEDYYQTLEAIRKSGIVNMWGASPVLADFAGIDQKFAQQILCSWISHYDELNDKYGWQK